MIKIQDVSNITAQDLREGALEESLPEYYELKNYREHSLWHTYEESVFQHVVQVYEQLEALLSFEFATDKDLVRLQKYFSENKEGKSIEELTRIATLLHDIAKGATLITKQDGKTASPFHEIIGGEMVDKFKDRFELTDEQYEFVRKIVLYHDVMHTYLSLSVHEPKAEETLMPLLKKMLGDAFVATALMVYADMLGSDVPNTDPDEFEARSSKALDVLSHDWAY